MSIFQLFCGNCAEVLKGWPSNSIDSLVTDPPYGLEFMNKDWDKAVPGVTYWYEILRVLKPGAHAVVFGGTRTYHRMVCSIEDAGFEIRDQIQWLYGTGFPKSLNVGNGLGTCLKPAHEPIVLARKPFAGTVTQNIERYGTGALNIDACRIDYQDDADKASATPQGRVTSGTSERIGARPSLAVGNVERQEFERPPLKGRWPANVLHDGSDEVLVGFPESRGQQGALSGAEPSSSTKNCYGVYARKAYAVRGDSGSAARFFYCAKATRTERGKDNDHPTVKPVALMRYLCRLVTPPGGTILDPFMGSGSTGIAACTEAFKFVGVELNPAYVELARQRIESTY